MSRSDFRNILNKKSVNFYIASRWENRDKARSLGAKINQAGHAVTSRWLIPGLHEVGKSLNADCQRNDLDDIDRADALVHLTATRENGYTSGGNHVEFGYALAKGKVLFVIGPKESVFHDNPRVYHFASVPEFLSFVGPSSLPMIGICGEGESGKDTLAELLGFEYGYHRHALADSLKEDIGRLLWPLESTTIGVIRVNNQKKTNPDMRSMLQAYGSLMRQQDENFWIDRLLKKIHSDSAVVVPDVRFLNEIALVRQRAGIMMLVERPGHENNLTAEQRAHATEQEWRTYKNWDIVIRNDGAPTDMIEQIKSNPAVAKRLMA